MGVGQNINISRSLEKADSKPHGNFEGFKISMEEIAADVVGRAKTRELEEESENVTELPLSYSKT